tara:strand:+ start:139 stop:567 length:429 start_codon:yes stop_codon:yes gene_type:complete
MTRKHKNPDTSIHRNDSFAAVDDYDTRMYILPYLIDEDSRKEIIAEHEANPLYSGTEPGKPAPMYSKSLVRLIDKLRMTPQKNKLTIVESKPWAEYKIGILPGNRGGKIVITDESYATRGKAEHAIFLKRLKVLLDQYGINL